MYTYIYRTKIGKKEKCPQCSKYLTRRTKKRHLKEGCPKNKNRKKKSM